MGTIFTQLLFIILTNYMEHPTLRFHLQEKIVLPLTLFWVIYDIRIFIKETVYANKIMNVVIAIYLVIQYIYMS